MHAHKSVYVCIEFGARGMGYGNILLPFAWAHFSLQQVVLSPKKSRGLPRKQRGQIALSCVSRVVFLVVRVKEQKHCGSCEEDCSFWF